MAVSEAPALATARLQFLRTSARKARFVIDTIRGKSVADALVILGTLNRRAAGPITKLLKSSVANAKQRDAAVTEGQLVIAKIVADEGPMWKRFRAAAMGRAVRIRKRTCHITIALSRPVARRAAASQPARVAARPAPAPSATGRGPSATGTKARSRRPLKHAAAAAA